MMKVPTTGWTPTTSHPRLSVKKAAILELVIARHEMYGLEIVRASEGRVKQGTLYVTLNRMSEKGYVTSRQDDQTPGAIGPPRRVYRATGYGVRVFNAWGELAARLALQPALELTR